jgi:hypothetical protein
VVGVYTGYCWGFRLIVQLQNAASKSGINWVDVLWTFLWGIYYLWSFGVYVNTVTNQHHHDAVVFMMGTIQLDKHFSGKEIIK